MPLLAVDIGNSRIKMGLFDALAVGGGPLPEPSSVLGWRADQGEQPLAELLAAHRQGVLQVAIASVNAPSAERFESALAGAAKRAGTAIDTFRLTGSDLPIENRTHLPQAVGVDRLLGGVAANVLRRPETPAIVVDLGTAITVDLIAPDGAFEGGAILPGIGLSARALAAGADQLPETPFDELHEAPDAVGRSTVEAIHAGLFWGAVGAVRELIARQRDRLTLPPQVLLTGGAAPSVARLLGGPDYTVRHVAHLVLAGIAIACDGPEPRA